MPIRQKMPDFVNLAATGTASLDLPTGMSYHNLIFYFGLSGALTRAMIKEIRVLINGKVFIRAPASILHRDNLYKGSVDNAAFFILDFEEPRARNFADQISSIVHTFSGVQTFKIEFDIEGATSPRIVTHANVTATKLPLGLLPCFFKQSVDMVSIGTHQIGYSYGKAQHVLKRVHIVPTQANVEVLPADVLATISVSKDNIPLYQKVSPLLAVYYQSHYEAICQTNFATVDFVEDNNVGLNLMPADDAVILWEFEALEAARLDLYYSVLASINSI